MSIFKTKAVKDLDNKDIAYTSVMDWIWSVLEADFGIICACLPFMQPVWSTLKAYFSGLTSSKGATSQRSLRSSSRKIQAEHKTKRPVGDQLYPLSNYEGSHSDKRSLPSGSDSELEKGELGESVAHFNTCGRSRLRKFQDRTSPSPSPLKKAATTPNMNPMQRMVANEALSSENEDDEDEETLQLRLQALEAKLKLKKLRQKKNKDQTNSSDIENERPGSSSRSSETAIKSTADKKDWMKLERPVRKSVESQPVQVPVSPQGKQVQEGAPRSPGRVVLGIDKGLKGKNVSLRRVPESKRSQALDDPFLEDALRSRELAQRSNVHGSRTHGHDLGSRPMTFSERIADTRQRDKEQKEKARRLQDQRSTGFGIGIEALESLRNTADEEAKVTAAFGEQNTAKPTFSREEVLRAASKPNGGLVRRNSTTSANQAVRRRKDFENPNAPPGFVKSVERPVKAHSPSPPTVKPKSASSKAPASTDPSLFEPFSSVHLTRRLIPHDSLTKAFTGKSILLLPDVLGTVKAPDYSFPDTLEADCVILAIIASKSTPLTHKDNKQHPKTAKNPPASTDVPTSSLTEAAESEANEQGKYMALTLTDLKWSLDLYLFTSAFTRWRKLAPGTVIAILNPNIMPPPPHNPHNNRFSLTLNSNDDTILEIGTSRDLSWCSSVKKDGKQCDAWIDKRHTSVCEFHVDRVIEKSRRGRMEINGVSVPFGPGGKKGSRSGFWGGSGGGKRHNINSSSWPGGHFDRREEARRNDRRPE
ncbi:MAG: hypothetical protein Q9188_002398, partial [Gyalolechia gomerana]